ncbi:putative hypothetical protein [Clostridium botulinum BKT015925]|nr:putative hypothetical protein [Clostridium botulinum BKT015925]
MKSLCQQLFLNFLIFSNYLNSFVVSLISVVSVTTRNILSEFHYVFFLYFSNYEHKTIYITYISQILFFSQNDTPGKVYTVMVL